MTTEKFIKKIILKAIIFIILTTFIISFTNSMDALASNYITLGQMENDDVMFVVMETYNNAIRPTATLAYTAITLYIITTFGIDIFKFTKNKMNGENKNEKLD